MSIINPNISALKARVKLLISTCSNRESSAYTNNCYFSTTVTLNIDD